MPFKLSIAVWTRTSFDDIKFYNLYHNKTIFILSLIFSASRIYVSFIAICRAHKHIIISDGHSFVCNTRCPQRPLQCYDKLQTFQSYSKREEEFLGMHFLGRLLIMCKWKDLRLHFTAVGLSPRAGCLSSSERHQSFTEHLVIVDYTRIQANYTILQTSDHQI